MEEEKIICGDLLNITEIMLYTLYVAAVSVIRVGKTKKDMFYLLNLHLKNYITIVLFVVVGKLNTIQK